MATENVSSHLKDWSEISDNNWGSLIPGNGFSRNIWHGFSYDNLKNEARLSEQAKAVFRALRTSNFERCLESLNHTRSTLQALRCTDAETQVACLYNHVRDQLFDTVGRSHVSPGSITSDAYKRVISELRNYDSIFTVNYDLIPYWSLMKGLTESTDSTASQVKIVDFFWADGLTFNPRRATPDAGQVGLYYLHGALHLWHDDVSNKSGKWRGDKETKLLDIKKKYAENKTRRPLFISEGSSEEKDKSIKKSEYLKFCLNRLELDTSDTIVFGYSFSQQDAHISKAIKKGRQSSNIAVSILPTLSPREIIKTKIDISNELEGHNVQFFDSTTHPLGKPELKAC